MPNRRLSHLVCLLVCLCLGLVCGRVCAGAPAALAQSPDTAAQIKRLLDEQAAAWNSGDGAAWASAFTEDADFVNIRGDVFTGRSAIAQQHTRILGGPFKGSHATVTVRRMTEPAPGVALVETDHEVTGLASLPPGVAATAPGILRTHMKYIAVQREGRWQFIAAQNTAILPAAPMPK